jgi:hypothetical protein
LFGASGYVVEEKLLGDFDDFDPILMTGIEGCWAFTMWMILLPIFSIISCKDERLCPFGTLENSGVAF